MSRRAPASRATGGRWSRDDDLLAVFVRGATVGAFVGAVIAGSTLWRRLRSGAAGGQAVSAGRPADTSAVQGPPAPRGVEGRGR